MIVKIILAIIIIIISGIHWYMTRSRFAKFINRFPSDKRFYPIIGHALVIGRDRDQWFKKLYEVCGTFKETFGGWVLLYGCLQVVSADDAEIILSSTKCIDKGVLYDFFHPWLGTGLLTSTGQKWHQRRKMLTPAFHYNILKIFLEIFGERSALLVEKLKKECKNTKIDIVPIVTETTMKTICESSMGIKLDENNKGESVYYQSLFDIVEVLMHRFFTPWLYSDYTYFFSSFYWKQRNILKGLHSFSKNIIEERKINFKNSDITDMESENNKPKKRLAMLDLLIHNQNLGNIDMDGIREEVDTFIFEGHDTTKSGLAFALLLLALHPDIQKKAIEELDEIFGDSKRHATYDDLQNMKYLERVIKETLRLYPSVPAISRYIKEDLQLTNHVVPAGTDIWLRIYTLHRDPKYFPDPEKFDPDRFLPENSVGRHPFAYIPFSAGPRNCIGQKFAMLELKSIVSAVLRNFTLEPQVTLKDLTFIVDLVLRVKEPIYIKFNRRQ